MLYVSPETHAYLTDLRLKQEVRREERAMAKVARRTRELSRQRFETLVDGTALILRTGDPTFFQFEGACRKGLRSDLVLQGWKWSTADSAAASVIAAALARLGAERPTWYEGQPDHLRNVSIERFFCDRCGTPLEEGRHRYCSKLCSKGAARVRNALFDLSVSQAEYQARLADRRAEKLKASSGDCDACGKHFIGSRPGVRFCSHKCGASERFKHKPRPCGYCGKVFPIVKGTPARFCSKECGNASRRQRVEISCAHCSTVFSVPPSAATRKYCSQPCLTAARNVHPQPTFTCEETR